MVCLISSDNPYDWQDVFSIVHSDSTSWLVTRGRPRRGESRWRSGAAAAVIEPGHVQRVPLLELLVPVVHITKSRSHEPFRPRPMLHPPRVTRAEFHAVATSLPYISSVAIRGRHRAKPAQLMTAAEVLLSLARVRGCRGAPRRMGARSDLDHKGTTVVLRSLFYYTHLLTDSVLEIQFKGEEVERSS